MNYSRPVAFFIFILVSLFLVSCSGSLYESMSSRKFSTIEIPSTLQKQDGAVPQIQKQEPLKIPDTKISGTNEGIANHRLTLLKKVSAFSTAHSPKKPLKKMVEVAAKILTPVASIVPQMKYKPQHKQKAQGWLGLALVCLIVGLVLTFLGFGLLGSLFWAIGIVILVVGIVFFILWLLAEAVTG